MEFYMKQSHGREALKDVGRAISTKTTIPILTGIFIKTSKEGVTFIASNSNIIIERHIPKEDVDVVEFGSIVVPSHHFIEVVKKLPDLIHILTKDLKMYISSDDIQTSLNGMDPEDYPKLPNIQEEASFQFLGRDLHHLIHSTVFAVSKQESSPALTGVNLSIKDGVLQAAATNSHRLALSKLQIQDSLMGDLIVPGNTLNELDKLLSDSEEVHVVFSDANISFQAQRFTLYSRLIEGKFPNVSELINVSSSTSLLLDRTDLMKSIDRACLFASDWQHYNVTMKVISKGRLNIYSNSSEVGNIQEAIRIEKMDGDDFQITFNGSFMMEALKTLRNDRVKLGVGGAMRPITIQGEGEQNQLHLISPVRAY
ncbi:DNA polymerase III subunit beta [Pontibacillus marinus]|uniref:Beta sliding clamp n=1 Tax=Pontibacillus marinus BH030004 = DSM 16465 TaxID=1385511 RepID=A0A0A5GAZ9_9BACI|nr:DNA polymerase III subunit beta [Pontibacillus marinus]KGX88295.1 DNA polymerase III subunit beta [Pontibacillus marinus BH030004 = DSM 16465]